MKYTWRDFAFVFMILAIIGLSIYVIKYINSESYKCMNNPLVYGVNHIQSDKDVSCFCSNGYSSVIVTNDSIKALDTGAKSSAADNEINISAWNNLRIKVI